MTAEAPPRTPRERLEFVAAHGTERQRAEALRILTDAGLRHDPARDTRERIRAGGPMALGRELMPTVVYGSTSPLHDHLNTWHLAEANGPPGAREADAAPRGHGKTTAGVELPAIWHAANCTRRFQVIISDTAAQARERIQAIKAAVETNEELREVYPKLRPAYDYGEPGTWRETDLVFSCGCRIVGYGAGTSIRGLKHQGRRPDLLYLDDLEDEDSVATEYQIAKRLRWLTRVALALGDQVRGMSVLWVGTILARDALLNLATGAALDEGQVRPLWARTWRARVFRAEREDTPKIPTTVTVEDPDTGDVFTITRDVGLPMWDELTREDLARKAGEIGAEAYAAEYQSDPVAIGQGMIQAPVPVTVVNPDAPVASWVLRLPDGRHVAVGSMQRAAALDPQLAQQGESNDPDLGAIAVVGQAGADTFLLDSWLGRDRDGQAGRLITMAQGWGCYAVGVEATAAQVLIADQAARLARLPVVPVKPTEGKTVRALGLSVRASSGRFYVVAERGHNQDTVGHLSRFPHGRYDDPTDATVMALELAVRGAMVDSNGGSAPRTGGYRG